MNLPTQLLTYYVKDYRNIILNTEFGKSMAWLSKKNLRNRNLEPVEAQNDLFLIIFVNIRPIWEWQEIKKFNFNNTNHISTKEIKKYMIFFK